MNEKTAISFSIAIACSAALVFVIGFCLKRIFCYFYSVLDKHFPQECCGLKAITRFHWPISLLLGSYGLLYSIELRMLDLIRLPPSFHSLQAILSFSCFCWMLVQWKNALRLSLLNKRNQGSQWITSTTIDLVMKGFTLAITLIVIFSLMKWFGFDVQSLLAMGGIGALAIGLAGKEILANLFGGVVIYFTSPFGVGDIVWLDDGKVEGKIEEIGWYLTKIRDFSKQPIYIPNALFLSKTIVNRTRMTHRRLKETIGVRYRDFSSLSALLSTMRHYLSEHSRVDQAETHYVRFISFGPSSLDILVSAYIRTISLPEFLEIKEEILFAIGQMIAEQNLSIAFPTHTVELTSMQQEKQRPLH